MDYDIEKDEYMKDWKEVRLGDVVDIQSGYAFKSKDFEENGEIPVIKIKNIVPPYVKISKEDTQYVSKEFLITKPQFLINYNDILISLTGSNVNQIESAVGKVGRNRIKNQEMFLNQRVGKIVLKNDELADYDYIYYFLSTSETRYNLASSASGSANQANISPDNIKSLEITLPPLPTQQKIAQILSSLDDKIELNNAINKNLEEIAQTLFKQWFVDFEFPASLASPLFQGGDREGDGYKSSGGEMVESELGLIPKGWRVDNLEGIASYLNGLAMQKFPPENENDYLPVIKIKELRTGITNDSDKASINIDKKYIINDGDILFSWSGSLEVVIWTGGTGGLNQHLFKVTSEIFEKWFYYLWTKYHLEKFRHIAESKATTMGHIKREDLKKSLVVIPNELELDKMNNIFNPILSKIIKNSIETQTLTKLRDELLPKLMSGEVRV